MLIALLTTATAIEYSQSQLTDEITDLPGVPAGAELVWIRFLFSISESRRACFCLAGVWLAFASNHTYRLKSWRTHRLWGVLYGNSGDASTCCQTFVSQIQHVKEEE
jgi:hypothetical protein